MDGREEQAPRRTKRRWLAKFLRDYGPSFTLIAVIISSWQSCRAYFLNKEANRAQLYIRQVQFRLDDKVIRDLSVEVMNAGQRAAHLRKHGMSFLPGPINGPNPVLPDKDMGDIDETIDRELIFTHDVPPELVAPLPPGGEKLLGDVYEAYRAKGQWLYFFGKVEYFDGFDVQTKPWCKYMDGMGRWESCPVHENR